MLEHTITPPAYYSFHPETGELLSSGVCDLSPARDSDGHLLEPDVVHIPGSSTLIAPPETGEKEAAIWLPGAGEWTVVEDHRGEVYWADHEFKVVTGLGKVDAPPMEVHDAQYVVGLEERGRIQVWINDDVIEIDDIPDTLPRRVLAAWEAKGETIRPADMLEGDFQPLPPMHRGNSPAWKARQAALDRQMGLMLEATKPKSEE